MNRFEIVENYLKSHKKDAWITLDYENRNPVLVSFVGDKMLTRKIVMAFIRGKKPLIVCHSIDAYFLNVPEITKDFRIRVYGSWQEMLDIEKEEFSPLKEVLMDVSENGLLPRISLADAGSVDFIRSLGVKTVSSGDLLQYFSAAYDEAAHQEQISACKKALKIKDEAFKKIAELVERDGKTDEYTIQKFICDRFHEEGMVYDDPAIVAVNANASNPHYGPTEAKHSDIRKGDVVLIDMWAKNNVKNGVYADITWMGYVGENVPDKVEERFQILRKAVDTAFAFVKEELPKRAVEGYEVDDVARKVVTEAGYGKYFTHRTGHNISVDVSPHGPGVNIDNLESHDTREIIPNISFSLEPGIYAPDFGMRSETDVYIASDRTPIMIAGRQEHVIPILKK